MDDLGALLREMRLESGIGLDQLARLTGKSKGHLSRIERGERPVSPALVLAYERALGVRMSSIHERLRSQVIPAGRTDGDDPMRRRNFLGNVMTIATGAATLSTLASRVTELDPLPPPARVGMAEVAEVEEATQLMADWDLRHGGRLAVEQGRSLLRWCMVLLNATMSPTTSRRLCSATSYLADRTAWASYDSGQHDLAIKLFQLGLHLATEAHDPNLRAQVLSDMANQQIFLRQPAAALALTAFADSDHGTLPEMRAALDAVTAEAYGALGHDREMRSQIGRAESSLVIERAAERPYWMGAFRNEATLHESAGNALYLL
jgi:transcriptional regulator with XRE-family HTH domain